VSELNETIAANIDKWCNRPLKGPHPYVFLHGIHLERPGEGGGRAVNAMMAIGVDQDGYREVLGVTEGAKEDAALWAGFVRQLKERGLSGVRLFVIEKYPGLVAALADYFPEALWQRCSSHFYSEAWLLVPPSKARDLASMLKSIHAQKDLEAARRQAEFVVQRLRTTKLIEAAEMVSANVEDTLQYFQFPPEHWRGLRTNRSLEQVVRKIRRRPNASGALADGHGALVLVAARLQFVVRTQWDRKRYMDMSRFSDADAGPAVQKDVPAGEFA
jgi:putative transposase